MPDFVPVDTDPFAPQLVKVDHDPFSEIDDSRAPFGTMSAGEIPAGTLQGQVLKHLSTDAVTAPIKAVQQFMDTGTPESAFNVGTTLAGGGMLAAEKNAAGIFGGKLSKMADHSAIAKAEEMEASGIKPDQIWYETKTGRAADGEWRQEIDDSNAILKIKPSDLKETEFDPRTGAPRPQQYLDEVVDHPDLIKAYPHLQGVKVEPLPDELAENGTRGDYDSSTNTIRLNKGLSTEQGKSTLLHEVQHAIQHREGFAPGDNPINNIPPQLIPAKQQFEIVRANTQNEIKNQYNTSDLGVEYMKDLIRREKYGPDAAPEVPKPYADAFQPILDKNPDVKERLSNIIQSERLISDAYEKAHAQYRAAMGETESRSTQKRMDFSADQRQFTPPRLTEDVPRDQQRDLRTPKLVPVSHDPFAGEP